MKKALILLFILCLNTAFSQEKTDKLLVNILKKKSERPASATQGLPVPAVPESVVREKSPFAIRLLHVTETVGLYGHASNARKSATALKIPDRCDSECTISGRLLWFAAI